MNEFEMVQEYFLPLTMGRDEAGALLDDAAVFTLPEGMDLVVSSDTLNSGTHFLENEKPANIAHKALRVNLSDMAAMGATPLAYQMNLAFAEQPDEAWVKAFSHALLEDNKAFNVFCSGGDTTVSEGSALISITIFGCVPKGQAVKRDGAQQGDLIVLTGPIGRAAVGVKCLLGLLDLDDPEPFVSVCHKPQPRVALSPAIANYAHAAVDISDGFIADLGHVCQSSSLAAEVRLGDMPFTDETLDLLKKGVVNVETLLTGGDDYEIAMAVKPDNLDSLRAEAEAHGIELSVVGEFKAGEGVHVINDHNEEMEFKRTGWTHF